MPLPGYTLSYFSKKTEDRLKVLKAKQKANTLKLVNMELKMLQRAIESYYRHNKNYPKDGGKKMPSLYQNQLMKAEPQYIYRIMHDYFETKTLADRNDFSKLYKYKIVKDKDQKEYYIVWSNGEDGKKDWTWNNREGKVVIASGKDDIIRTNAKFIPNNSSMTPKEN